jgi:hypothetical protein
LLAGEGASPAQVEDGGEDGLVVLVVGDPPTETVDWPLGGTAAPPGPIRPTFVELLEAAGDSGTIVFTAAELLGGAPVITGGSCAGPEDDGCPGPPTLPLTVEEVTSDPEATPAGCAGGAEAPPLTGGVPESVPGADAPRGEQLGAVAPAASAAPLLSADPTGAEHGLPDPSSDELTAGPGAEGAMLVPGEVVVDEDAGAVVAGAGGDAAGGAVVAGGRVVAGEVDGGLVAAAGAVFPEHSVDPATAPPAGPAPAGG